MKGRISLVMNSCSVDCEKLAITNVLKKTEGSFDCKRGMMYIFFLKTKPVKVKNKCVIHLVRNHRTAPSDFAIIIEYITYP